MLCFDFTPLIAKRKEADVRIVGQLTFLLKNSFKKMNNEKEKCANIVRVFYEPRKEVVYKLVVSKTLDRVDFVTLGCLNCTKSFVLYKKYTFKILLNIL